MSDLLTFLYIQGLFVVLAFVEITIEGPHGWASKLHGWVVDLKVRKLTEYHFWTWLVFLPGAILLLPLVIFGWDAHLFFVLLASFLVGTVIEDFTWFLANPYFGIKKFNPAHVHWHHWLKIGKFGVPEFYIISPLVAFLIWFFLL